MKSTNTTTEVKETIVCFHIGKGGYFNNPGHLYFLSGSDINEFTNDLFVNYENKHKLSRLLREGFLPNLMAKYEECCNSEDFSFFENKGFDLGDKIYTNCNGDSVGLLYENNGIGEINIDNDYDTTYCKLISDCTEIELKLIVRNSPYYLVQLLKDAGYDNVEVLYAFDLLTDMIEMGDTLKIHGILEVNEEDYNAHEQEKRYVSGKYYII